MNIRTLSLALLASAAPGFAVVAVPAGAPYSVVMHDVSFGGDLAFNDLESVHGVLLDRVLGGFPKVQAKAEKVPARSELSLTREYDGDTAWSSAVAAPLADPSSYAEIWLNGSQARTMGADAGAGVPPGRALKVTNLGFREWTLSADQDGVTEGVTFTYSTRQIVAF